MSKKIFIYSKGEGLSLPKKNRAQRNFSKSFEKRKYLKKIDRYGC